MGGTWGSGAAPAEWADFILMRRMHWSWEQLQATPLYVRRYCHDMLGIIDEQQEREAERERRRAESRAARG